MVSDAWSPSWRSPVKRSEFKAAGDLQISIFDCHLQRVADRVRYPAGASVHGNYLGTGWKWEVGRGVEVRVE